MKSEEMEKSFEGVKNDTTEVYKAMKQNNNEVAGKETTFH